MISTADWWTEQNKCPPLATSRTEKARPPAPLDSSPVKNLRMDLQLCRMWPAHPVLPTLAGTSQGWRYKTRAKRLFAFVMKARASQFIRCVYEPLTCGTHNTTQRNPGNMNHNGLSDASSLAVQRSELQIPTGSWLWHLNVPLSLCR